MQHVLLPVVLLFGAVFVVALVLAARRNAPSRVATVEKKRLLTPNEFDFYQRLVLATPKTHTVLTQVAMGALLDAKKGGEVKDRFRVRNTFDRKIVDFVLMEARTGDVSILIELDDRTHRIEKDVARDAMTSEAGYRTLRFESRKKPDAQELRAVLVRALSS